MAKNAGPKSSTPKPKGNTTERPRAARRPASATKRHDWPGIKRAFIEGIVEGGRLIYPGPSKLAELFGAPRTKISARASEEGWETERALRQRGIQEAATVQKASLLAAELAMEKEAQRLEKKAPRRVADRPRAAPGAADAPPNDESAPNKAAEGDGASAGPSGMPATHYDVPVVRRTLDGSAIQLATAVAAFDAKAARIAEGAMAVGAKLLLGKEVKGEGDGQQPRRAPLTPKEYKETVEGIRAAHAMGRLALGQTTDNQGISNPNGGPVKVDQNVSVNDGSAGDPKLDNLSPAELARLYVEAARTGAEGGEE